MVDLDDSDQSENDDDEIIVKLIDYGLMTRKRICNERVGKTNYMSPRCYARQCYDVSANEVWCLAVCLYTMLTGCVPYDRLSVTYGDPPALQCIRDGNLR